MANYMVVNKGKTNVYLDIDGKKDTDDIVIIGPKGNTKVKLTNERVEQIKTEHPSLVIKKLGE